MRWTDALPSATTPSLPGLHPLLQQILARRGITTNEKAEAFLNPALYSPASATALPGVEAAVERISAAIRNKERVLVWGDFDVDGQTATALLVQTLRALGLDVGYHLPVRSRESHGVNTQGLQEEIDKGAQLIITCDTGITSHTAADYARDRGVDMIITDHHDMPPRIPSTLAVIDPKMLPPGHPLSTLSGAGVAYKLAEALLHEHKTALSLTDLLDLVALGLVADLALLTGDTRYLVQRGLMVLRATQRRGLQALYELAEIQPSTINESHVGFTLAPRLNALGRLGDANPIVEFLLTDDQQRARVQATQLENYNAQRRLLTSQVMQAAEAFLEVDPSLLTAPIIIVGHPTWPGGVLGIVAARLVEKYGKPAIVFSTTPGEPSYGSARSVEGLHITEAIAAQSDLLLSYGGHPMAAGLSLNPEKLHTFYDRMVWTVEHLLSSARKEEPSLVIDTWVPLSELNPEFAGILEQAAPFGPGNPRIVLASDNLKMDKCVSFGRNQEHRKLTVSDEHGHAQVVTWWDGNSEPMPEGRFDLAYTLRASTFQGGAGFELEYVASHPLAESAQVVEVVKPKVIDHRAEKDPAALLETARALPSTFIWAEGDEKARLNAKDSSELTPAENLVIWTIPASPEALHAALEVVQPKTIWLIAADAQTDVSLSFIDRLTGLLKYAIARHNGQVTYQQLAGATAQSVDTVRNGLAWLVARGTVGIRKEANGELLLSSGSSFSDPVGAARLWVEIQGQLAETAAYRAHFRRADKDSLFS